MHNFDVFCEYFLKKCDQKTDFLCPVTKYQLFQRLGNSGVGFWCRRLLSKDGTGEWCGMIFQGTGVGHGVGG